MQNWNNFGDQIQEARRAAGLSREELAERAGLDLSYVYRLEKGQRQPSRDCVLNLARTLGLSAEGQSELLLSAGFAPTPSDGGTSAPARALRTRGAPRPFSAADWPPDQWAALGLDLPVWQRLARALEKVNHEEKATIVGQLNSLVQRWSLMLESPVRKAVIPAAGRERRVLSGEMIYSLLLRAIDEAANADIPHVILVLAPDSVEPVYSRLVTALVKRSPPAPVTLDYCVQPEPRSTGDALLRAEELVGGQPFVVLFPDDIIRTPPKRPSRPPLLRRMMRLSQERDGASIVAVTPVSRRKMADCGVVEVQPCAVEERVFPITRLVETPRPEDPVYDLYDQAHTEGAAEVSLVFGIAGRYLLPPDIFAALRELQPAKDGQLLLTDALEHLRRAGHALYALAFEEEREDLGEVVEEVEEWGEGKKNFAFP